MLRFDMLRSGDTSPSQKRSRKIRPGQVLVLGFLCVILAGAVLLTLPVATADRNSLGFLDALFTATSAVCVTGLTVVNVGVTFSLFGQIVLLLLIQIGGLGFMTITSLLFMVVGKRISLKERLLIQESYNLDSIQGVVRLVRNALTVELSGQYPGDEHTDHAEPAGDQSDRPQRKIQKIRQH